MTVLVPTVNGAPVSLTPPPRFNVLEPPLIVPAVLVQVPVNVWVRPAPRLSVPPVPLIVSPPPLTLPVNVAVPAVLVIETVPVVVKPAILFAATVPPRVTSYEPKFNVPPPVLVRFPWMVKFVLAPAVPVPLNSRF